MFRIAQIITGCLISLTVIVARHGLDMLGVLWMGILLGIVFGVVTIVQPVYTRQRCRLEAWRTRLQVCLQSHIPIPQFRMSRLLSSEYEREMLHDNILILKKELQAFSSYATVRSGEEVCKQFLVEYQSLIKALTHIGNPDDTRMKADDVTFYGAWVNDLTQRLREFRQKYKERLSSETLSL